MNIENYILIFFLFNNQLFDVYFDSDLINILTHFITACVKQIHSYQVWLIKFMAV